MVRLTTLQARLSLTLRFNFFFLNVNMKDGVMMKYLYLFK